MKVITKAIISSAVSVKKNINGVVTINAMVIEEAKWMKSTFILDNPFD